LTIDVALQTQANVNTSKGLEDIKDHLTKQDGILGALKTQQAKWMGAIAVIIAIPAIFAIGWQIFHK